MRDKIITGAVGGGAGGILQEALHLVLNIWWLKTTNMLLASIAGAMMLGHRALSWGEFFVGFIGHLIFSGIFGFLLAYILEYTEYRYYIFKGALFGAALWFVDFTAGTQLHIDGVHLMPWTAKLAFLPPHILYGLTSAYLIQYLDERMGKRHEIK